MSQNLSQLIRSTRGTFVPSLVKIRSRVTSGQIGEMSLSCDFIFFSEARALTDFDAWWLKMRGITQGCAFWGLKYLILTFDRYLLPKMSNFAPKIAISSQNDETWKSNYIRNTKPMYLKTWHNVKNVKKCSQMQYDDVTTNPIWRTAAILWKSYFGYISAIYCSINAKFGTL